MNKRLSHICQEAIQLDLLNELVKKYLPPHLSPHCHVGSFLKGSLILRVENAVWITELKYSLSELRSRLRQEKIFAGLMHIKTKISA